MCFSPILHSRRKEYDILPKSTFGTEHLPGARVIMSIDLDKLMSLCLCVCDGVHTHLTGGRNFHFIINTM